MGIFDILENVVEGAVETVTRLPVEGPARIIKGTIDGVEEGIDKTGEALDRILED